MSMIRRFGFLILVNLMIMVTLSVLYSVLQIFLFNGTEATGYENSLAPLMLWSVVWGFGGAFISLFMSKFLAKRMYRLKMIDPRTATGTEREIVDMVHQLARAARLPKPPEVGIYDSPDMNAFATGPSKKNSLVAVSTGLLRSMDRNQVEGVLGHEVAHIANGDMVTMTLLQGVINAFVLFFARILAKVVSNAMQSSNDNRGGGGSFWMEYLLFNVFQIIFGILGSLVVAYYSRAREFRADKGGARYAGRDKMISALQALKKQAGLKLPADAEPDADGAFASFKISRSKTSQVKALFSTHPPLDLRISRLERGA